MTKQIMPADASEPFSLRTASEIEAERLARKRAKDLADFTEAMNSSDQRIYELGMSFLDGHITAGELKKRALEIYRGQS